MTTTVAGRRAWPPGTLVDLASTAAVTVAVWLSGLPWLRAVHAPGASVALAAAAVVPVAAAALMGRLGVPAAAAVVAHTALVVSELAVFAGPDPVALGRSLTREPADLLVETLPLTGARSLLAVPLVITAITAVVAGETDARLRRSGIALAAPMLGLAGVWAMTSGAGPLATLVPTALVGAVALGAAARAATVPGGGWRGAAATAAPGTAEPVSGGRGPLRRVSAVVAASAAATAAAGVTVPAALGHRPTATLHRSPPAVTPTITDPVDATATQRAAAEAGASSPALLRVTTDGPSSGYLATSIVDRYDGAAWSFTARFTPTGGAVPDPAAPPLASGADRVVTQVVRVVGPLPTGPLPALDRPVAVRGASVDADPGTGMVLAAAGRPAAYAVTSRAPTVSLAGLPAADGLVQLPTGAPGVALPAGAAPDVAAVVRSLATATGAAPTATVGWLQAVAAVFARLDRRAALTPPGGVSGASSASGTTLASVIDATTVTRVATPEQFATLVAVVARSLGVPARVATGYRLPGAGGPRPVPAGSALVDARDAWTWAEVPVSGVGWVPVDVTPATTSSASPPPPLPASGTPPSTGGAPHPLAVPKATPRSGHALAPPVAVARPRPDRGLAPLEVAAVVAAGSLAGLVVAATAAVGLVAAARRARRRRRRSGDPRRRAIGAWLEVLDVLARAGLRPRRSATAAEVAVEVAAAFGAPVARPVGVVGALAEQAVYSSAALGPAAADRAWAAQSDAVDALADALDRRARLVGLVRPAGSRERRR
ncbi:MAG TPA: transglutaminase-like domain-containing protein [Acidimicrobiales bacterium]|nr:transglutaminase-like domain-containing protein [Acidimicrobiales bacterium]